MSDDSIRKLKINPCYGCNYWDSLYSVCRMPETDMGDSCDLLILGMEAGQDDTGKQRKRGSNGK